MEKCMLSVDANISVLFFADANAKKGAFDRGSFTLFR